MKIFFFFLNTPPPLLPPNEFPVLDLSLSWMLGLGLLLIVSCSPPKIKFKKCVFSVFELSPLNWTGILSTGKLSPRAAENASSRVLPLSSISLCRCCCCCCCCCCSCCCCCCCCCLWLPSLGWSPNDCPGTTPWF